MSIETTSLRPWHESAIYKQPLPRQNDVSDFRKKLEMEQTYAEAGAMNEDGSKYSATIRDAGFSSANEKLHGPNEKMLNAPGVLSMRNDVLSPVIPSELYALKLTAGRHLSYVPHNFSMDQMLGKSTQVSAPPQESTRALSDPLNEAELHLGEGEAIQTSRAEQDISGPVLKDAESTEVPSEWVHFAATRWPSRRISITPREKGLEILIRDYHLTTADKDTMVQSILSRLSSITPGLAHIWINGEVVWRRDSGSALETGGMNGD